MIMYTMRIQTNGPVSTNPPYPATHSELVTRDSGTCWTRLRLKCEPCSYDHGFESQVRPYYHPWFVNIIPMFVGFTVVNAKDLHLFWLASHIKLIRSAVT